MGLPSESDTYHLPRFRAQEENGQRPHFDCALLQIENGAQLEDVQNAAGHRDPSTTKLYDRRHYNPEKAAASLLPTEPCLCTPSNRHRNGSVCLAAIF